MYRQIEEQNDKAYDYLPYICTFSSVELLKHINKVDHIDIKLMFLYKINKIFENISIKLFKKYNPILIYFFNNEFTLLFVPEINNEIMFNGNVNKTLTHISSYISILVTKELNDININKSFIFTGKAVEFSNKHEAFNFLIWRQFDCKRNNINLFYRCLFPKQNLTQITSAKMLEEIYNHNVKLDADVLHGFIISKDKETYQDDFTYNRSKYITNHDFLGNDFHQFFERFIKKRIS
jgi:tRNA(His) 5'-end guanylyltransferase